MKSVFSQKPCDICCVYSQVGNPYNWERECDRCIKLGQWKNEVLIRLSKIEDILGDEYDLDRLKELVQADIEGRCVVLPCKVGDTIYTIGASICKWREIDHCDEYCDGQQYRDCWEGESTVLERKFGLYDIVSINKTVFLTRKEAEVALEKMKEGDK